MQVYRTLAVIPARFASVRLPGKPLIDLDGLPMVVRVAQRAARAQLIDRVLVATDDERIFSAVAAHHIDVVMTPDCRSGSDRVAAALDLLSESPDLVVNVQGDEPLLDPADIDCLVSEARRHDDGITTLVRPLSEQGRFLDPNVVKAVVAADRRALYFSRVPVPSGAQTTASSLSDRPLQHVGIYAYPPRILRAFVVLPPSRLEVLERLEQLRALEAGIPIYVAESVSERPSVGVDTADDVEVVRRMLEQDSKSNVYGVGRSDSRPSSRGEG